MHGKLFEHTQVGVLAITFRKSNHVQTLHLDLFAGSGSGVPGGGETKNKSQKQIAGFFQKMKKYWSKFRSIKNTNRIDMQYVVAKLCFRTQVSCKYTHTCNQTTRQTSVHAESNLDLDPSQKEKRDIQYCYWHAIDTDALSSGANYFN